MAAGLTMCVLIVACNLGVIEALYQMNRRSENRRLTRYPSEMASGTQQPTTTTAAAAASHLPLRDTKSKRFQDSLRQSVETDDNSSYISSSFSRHHLSVRQRDSSGSSSSHRHHHHHHHHHQHCNQTQEEIKFARLMAVLCIFYVLCWIPQLVRKFSYSCFSISIFLFILQFSWFSIRRRMVRGQ